MLLHKNRTKTKTENKQPILRYEKYFSEQYSEVYNSELTTRFKSRPIFLHRWVVEKYATQVLKPLIKDFSIIISSDVYPHLSTMHTL